MWFVYLDEFGHDGPFVSVGHPSYNTSPVFGFGGLMLPSDQVRNFATFFYQLKSRVLAHDLRSVRHPHKWEKKGTSFFTKRSITKYDAVRLAGFRLLNRIHSAGGHVVWYGREKSKTHPNPNSIGLRTTSLSHTIRKLDESVPGSGFCIVLDEHTARSEQLECAQKTMFGKSPTRKLISPPFEVKSDLDQNMQAADWIACLVGRVAAYQLEPIEFAEYEPYNKYFGSRLRALSTPNSMIDMRPKAKVVSTILKVAVRTM